MLSKWVRILRDQEPVATELTFEALHIF